MPTESKHAQGLRSLERPFVGRDDFRTLFRETVEKKNKKIIAPDRHKVLVFYGVAGIGKSRLQQQLAEDLKDMWKAAVCMTLDFDRGRHHIAEDALPVIRWTLKDKYKVPFPTFDLAFAIYWQKRYPHIALNKDRSFRLWEESGLLADVVAAAGEIPIIGFIPKIGKVIEKSHRHLKDWWTKRGEATLQSLAGKKDTEIEDLLPTFLAMDIKNYLQEYPVPVVIFLDTYEELFGKEHAEDTLFTKDQWVKTLVANLPQALWVITGREELLWAKDKKEWDDHLEQREIFGLENKHAGDFLKKCGVESQEIREVILKQSLEAEEKYVPFHLNAYLDFYEDILRKGQQPTANDLNVPPHEFYKLFTRHLDKDQVEAFKVLSAPRWWDDELVKLLFEEFGVKYHHTALPELYRFSFIKPGPRPDTLTMHDRMRDCLQNWLKGNKEYRQLWENLHEFLFTHYQAQLEGLDVKSITDRHGIALTEGCYHANLVMDANGFVTWLTNATSIFKDAAHWSTIVPLYVDAIGDLKDCLSRDDPSVATLLNNLALLYKFQGRYAEAEPLYKWALAIDEKALGKEHPDVATDLNNIAALYDSLGRYAEAEPLYKRALAIDEKALGKEHPDVATDLNNIAVLYDSQGRYAEAEPLYKRALAIVEKSLGEVHPYVASSLNNLALLYKTTGRYAEAEPLYKRAIEIGEKTLGKEHPDVATWLNNLAGLYYSQGRYAEAEPLYKRALEIDEKALGKDHPDVATDLNNIALLYHAQGRYAEAEPLLKRALEIYDKAHGENHPLVATALNNLAGLYRDTGRYSEAEPLYKRALAIIEKALPPDHPDLAMVLENVAVLYRETGKNKEAEKLEKRAREIRERREK